MSELINYIIPLKGLRPGIHSYDFQVTEAFFEAMQSKEIHPTKVDVKMGMDFREGLISLNFVGKGSMTFPCDLCLELFDQAIEFTRTVVLKYGEGDSEDDDVLYISPQENQLDVSQIIYDEIILSLPMKKTHPLNEDESPSCNPEQLKFLEQKEEEKPMDPRWEALKKLKFED